MNELYCYGGGSPGIFLVINEWAFHQEMVILGLNFPTLVFLCLIKVNDLVPYFKLWGHLQMSLIF